MPAGTGQNRWSMFDEQDEIPYRFSRPSAVCDGKLLESVEALDAQSQFDSYGCALEKAEGDMFGAESTTVSPNEVEHDNLRWVEWSIANCAERTLVCRPRGCFGPRAITTTRPAGLHHRAGSTLSMPACIWTGKSVFGFGWASLPPASQILISAAIAVWTLRENQ